MADNPFKASGALTGIAGLHRTTRLFDIAAGLPLANLKSQSGVVDPTRGAFRDLISISAAARGLTPDLGGLHAATRMGDIARGFSVAGFVRPEMRALTGLSEAAASIVAPFRGVAYGETVTWVRRLDLGMRSISADWAAKDDLEASAEAFARLTRFADVARDGRDRRHRAGRAWGGDHHAGVRGDS